VVYEYAYKTYEYISKLVYYNCTFSIYNCTNQHQLHTKISLGTWLHTLLWCVGTGCASIPPGGGQWLQFTVRNSVTCSVYMPIHTSTVVDESSWWLIKVPLGESESFPPRYRGGKLSLSALGLIWRGLISLPHRSGWGGTGRNLPGLISLRSLGEPRSGRRAPA